MDEEEIVEEPVLISLDGIQLTSREAAHLVAAVSEFYHHMVSVSVGELGHLLEDDRVTDAKTLWRKINHLLGEE